MVESMTPHAGWVLFVWVLANQTGVAVPVASSLLAAGSALVWAGSWVSVGYLLSGAVAGNPARFGILFSILMAGGLTAASASGLILMRSQAIAESLLSLRDRICGLYLRRCFCPRAGDATLGSGNTQGS